MRICILHVVEIVEMSADCRADILHLCICSEASIVELG